VNGLGRARTILDAVRKGTSDLHFVEVMTCPGGCVGGGGQPYGSDVDVLRDRLERLYETDRRAGVRVPSDNGDVRELYETLLGEPLSAVSHRLLHRAYTDRRAEATAGAAGTAAAAGAGEVAA
jgi:iron only hydrogenase large subunit-like protein